jgi:hypothetical protein
MLGHEMKKRIIMAISSLFLCVIVYAIFGGCGKHEEECMKCGKCRTQYRLGSLTVYSQEYETDCSEWYKQYDSAHVDCIFGPVCGWQVWGKDPGHYDCFGWQTAYTLRQLKRNQDSYSQEEFKEIMRQYVAIDPTNQVAQRKLLPKETEEEPQQDN